MLRKFKQWFIESFEFNRQQLRGMMVLTTLVMGILIIRHTIPLRKPFENRDINIYTAKIEEFHNNLRQQEPEKAQEGELFYFDPNNLPDEDWQRLGLSERQIAVIKRYEAKGGKFYSGSDLKKMYCIPSYQYDQLEPFIKIDNRENRPSVSIPTGEPSGKINPFPFNPDRLPRDQWLKLGLSEKQVDVILKYELKGGKFRRKEDLKKMYVISEQEYKILEPFIEIPADSSSTGTIKPDQENAEIIPEKKSVEINTADSAEWVMLPGIRPSIASRIIKYRDKLGGFYSADQLTEVYGMDSVKLNRIKPYLAVDEKRIRKIRINAVEFKELMKHPYFNYATTKAIFEQKNKKGFISGIEELKTIPLMHHDLFNKITPYITTD